MSYGKDLLDRAAAKAGSRYALAKITGIDEGDLSKAAKGTRNVPASWVLPLARVAEVNPTEAMEFWDLERAEKKRRRRLSSSSAAGGVAATLLTFAVSVVPDHHALAMSGRLAIDTSTHRINRLWVFLRRHLFIRATMTAMPA